MNHKIDSQLFVFTIFFSSLRTESAAYNDGTVNVEYVSGVQCYFFYRAG